MLKAITITLISAGVLGTGAHNLAPQSLNITAGSTQVIISADGVKTQTTDKPDVAFTLVKKDGHGFTIKL